MHLVYKYVLLGHEGVVCFLGAWIYDVYHWHIVSTVRLKSHHGKDNTSCLAVPHSGSTLAHRDIGDIATLRGSHFGIGLRTRFRIHFMAQIPVSPR